MAKIVVTYTTPDDPESFDRHYKEVHIPLALKLPGLKKFETSEGPVTTPAGPSPVHFVAILHFDDMASLQAGLASPEGQAAAADAQTIMAPGSGMLIFDSSAY